MLQSLADEQRLCYGLRPGLEPLSRGRACFRSALGRCAGACCGKESVEAHRDRLLAQMSKAAAGVLAVGGTGGAGGTRPGYDAVSRHS